jgi:hypothetical protein
MSKAAFTNHKHNGVFLEFPNGNSISTIWGVGSYSDNHDLDFNHFSTLLKQGSMTCEIMFKTTDDELRNRIFSKCGQDPDDDGVIGWVNITTWLWVLNQLAKGKENTKED